MTTTEFHYTTYIKSTPERVWAAIITPEFTRQYWGKDNISDWRPGSRWEHRSDTGTIHVTGIVRESVPPTRLVLSWAAPGDHEDQAKHSRVTFEIVKMKDLVQLHITHDLLEAGSQMAHSISGGWPRVLSSLKTFLETGAPLDTWAGQNHTCGAAPAK
jgi:uncharacterized protein YndB with AHSA1/START domain